jgi:hypothetical protein
MCQRACFTGERRRGDQISRLSATSRHNVRFRFLPRGDLFFSGRLIEKAPKRIWHYSCLYFCVELPSRGRPNADPETGGISMFITVLAIIYLKNNEKNGEQVIEKMAEAARELGWPNQIVDAARMQMEAVVKMQVQTMDRMMDTWEEQIKSLNPSSTMLSKLTSLPNFGPVGSWPNTGNPQMAALNPFQFYIQVAQQWQKIWADAMASWAKASTSSRA